MLSDGVTYAGIRDLTPNVTPFIWYDLTDPTLHPGYPSNACAVSVASQANNVSVQVLTENGEVWETRCEIVPGTPDALDCVGEPMDDIGPWFELTTPTPGDPPLKKGAAKDKAPTDKGDKTKDKITTNRFLGQLNA
ncbi:hypothetical protein [Streptomyces sp. NPDC085466]|uniref:hypothetical protein n=1 Tax=Streptomyces sp. NPDC085466 TaxID=3365725 RepID=UPI0037D9723D